VNLSEILNQLRLEHAQVEEAIASLERLDAARSGELVQGLTVRRRGRPAGSKNRPKPEPEPETVNS
jgi:hypothetical protein